MKPEFSAGRSSLNRSGKSEPQKFLYVENSLKICENLRHIAVFSVCREKIVVAGQRRMCYIV
ncbi:MAG: hypothetical protein BWK80_00120 [Desulfobacteraceae bacterium IS3]|nr:MAG: hypothetical protein BWK80_00120 [Desulfobacteraceae bacterium IS3]